MRIVNIILFLLLWLSIFSGNVYVTDFSWDADIKVYITNKSYEADLIVYKTKYEWDAKGKDYIWHIEKSPWYADIKIKFVKFKNESDIKVFFVDSYRKSWCGWKTDKVKKYEGIFK